MALKFKRRLSEHEEFEIMKIVLDKFLWLGTAFAGFGLYKLVSTGAMREAITYISVAVVLMILFGWIIVREFEQLR